MEKMSRRSILHGAIVLPTLTLPFIAANAGTSHEPISKHLRPFLVSDAHAKPYAAEGDYLFYDAKDREPAASGVFIVLCDSGREFVVKLGGGTRKGWHVAAPNHWEIGPAMLVPISTERLRNRLLGRVVLKLNRVA